MRTVAGFLLILLAARPAMAADCDLRHDRDRKAFAEALVKTEAILEESAADGLGDHCDDQLVQARVVRPLAGAIATGETVRFVLSQGACHSAHSIDNDFVEPGSELVVLLARDVAGGIYQIRAESSGANADAAKVCGVARVPGPR